MSALHRLWFVVPLVALAAIVAWLLLGAPLADLTSSSPPVEELAVESVDLSPGRIAVTLRADGSAPITVAQVQVDGAWRQFSAEPSSTISQLSTSTISIPFPWVEGEAHHILFLTGNGTAFEHSIEVATATSAIFATMPGQLLLVGILLGFVPVALGLLTYPALRKLGPAGMQFLLALTVGLLAYLLIDTLTEGLEIGVASLDRLRGGTIVWVAAAFTTLALLAIGRRHGKAPEGIALAIFIALGIGLHNLGEGLVVGAALATGASALATFLVVGFVVHNVTEGIGIAAPLATIKRPSLLTFAGLAALAGLPAILGVFVGTGAISPYLTALAFGIGAGAILQVIIEVSALTIRRSGMPGLYSPASAGGIMAGLAIMYATALLV